MSDGLTISEISMQNDLLRLQTISHNLANVTTAGYKQQIAGTTGFDESMNIATMENAGIQQGVSIPVTIPMMSQTTDLKSGTLKFTGNPLDVALSDGVFLTVQTKKGEAYTRQGDLHIDAQGRLVTAKGMAVMGTGGDIQMTSDKPVINQQGQILENAISVAELKLVKIPAEAEVVSIGDGLYRASLPVTTISNESVIRQGYLEGSNVDMTQQMVKMIELTRHFESTQRVIRGYDEMLDKAINVIGEF